MASCSRKMLARSPIKAQSQAKQGITVGSGGGHVTINNSGLIQGAETQGLNLNAAVVTIINSGTIRGGSSAILSSGVTSLTNSGQIDGSVHFSTDRAYTPSRLQKEGRQSDQERNRLRRHRPRRQATIISTAATITRRWGCERRTIPISFGGGNDYYIATSSDGTGNDDVVNGGTALILTMRARKPIRSSYFLNLGQTVGANIGNDTISGFENAIGGSSADTLQGQTRQTRSPSEALEMISSRDLAAVTF